MSEKVSFFAIFFLSYFFHLNETIECNSQWISGAHNKNLTVRQMFIVLSSQDQNDNFFRAINIALLIFYPIMSRE